MVMRRLLLVCSGLVLVGGVACNESPKNSILKSCTANADCPEALACLETNRDEATVYGHTYGYP